MDTNKWRIDINKWDRRFLELARLVSTWSKDPSTQTGAVLVSPDRTDIILGYNGFAKRMQDTDELYNDRESKYSRIIHCEMNAILLAKRSLEGYTLYTWPFLSCDRCAVHVIQSGVRIVVAPLPDQGKLERWGKSFELSKKYFNEAGVSVKEFDTSTW